MNDVVRESAAVTEGGKAAGETKVAIVEPRLYIEFFMEYGATIARNINGVCDWPKISTGCSFFTDEQSFVDNFKAIRKYLRFDLIRRIMNLYGANKPPSESPKASSGSTRNMAAPYRRLTLSSGTAVPIGNMEFIRFTIQVDERTDNYDFQKQQREKMLEAMCDSEIKSIQLNSRAEGFNIQGWLSEC